MLEVEVTGLLSACLSLWGWPLASTEGNWNPVPSPAATVPPTGQPQADRIPGILGDAPSGCPIFPATQETPSGPQHSQPLAAGVSSSRADTVSLLWTQR